MGIAFSPRRRCNCSKLKGAPLRNGSLCRGAGCVRGTLCAVAKLAATAASKTVVRKNRQIRFIHTLLHFLFGVLRAANSLLPHSSLGAIGVRRQNLVYQPYGSGISTSLPRRFGLCEQGCFLDCWKGGHGRGRCSRRSHRRRLGWKWSQWLCRGHRLGLRNWINCSHGCCRRWSFTL